LINYLASLKIAQEKKKVSFTYFYVTKSIIANTKILLKLGYIYSYELKIYGISNKNYIIVYLRYSPTLGSPVVREFKFFSTIASKHFIKISELRRICRRNQQATYIISTSEGLMDGYNCLQKRKCGLLLYRIN